MRIFIGALLTLLNSVKAADKFKARAKLHDDITNGGTGLTNFVTFEQSPGSKNLQITATIDAPPLNGEGFLHVHELAATSNDCSFTNPSGDDGPYNPTGADGDSAIGRLGSVQEG